MRKLIFLFLLMGCITSCGYKDDELHGFDEQIKKYNKKNNLGLKPTGSGLYLKVDSLGSGRLIQIQDSIWVRYSLRLLDGTIIENNPKPIGLKLNATIKGWQEALFALPIGSTISCIIPPQLAYGQQGNGKVGKDKILSFQLKVIDAK